MKLIEKLEELLWVKH